MFDLLVSVVVVVRNCAESIAQVVDRIQDTVASCVSDYEIVVVDNASTDGTVAVLERLVQKKPNIQVYCLTTECDRDVACVAGLENAIGDYVVMLDPHVDEISVLPKMLEAALDGHDVVFGKASICSESKSGLYGLLSRIFVRILSVLVGVKIPKDSPSFRLMSRRTVNYVMLHDLPYFVYQIIPILAGFSMSLIEYDARVLNGVRAKKSIRAGLNKALALLVSTTALPMRIITAVFIAGSLLNLLYSTYVILIYVFKKDVAPGWTTLSLQFSGMFFLFSIALAILSEYVVRIADASIRRPMYHISREFRSPVITREQRLNILAGDSRFGEVPMVQSSTPEKEPEPK